MHKLQLLLLLPRWILCFLLSASGAMLLAIQNDSVQLDTAAAIKQLEAHESSFFGLRFDYRAEYLGPDRKPMVLRSGWVSIGEDGKLRTARIASGASGDYVVRIWADGRAGWLLNSSPLSDGRKPEVKRSRTVLMLAPDNLDPAALSGATDVGYGFGYSTGTRDAGLPSMSRCRWESGERVGFRGRFLVCERDRMPTWEFGFDDQGILRMLVQRVKNGDGYTVHSRTRNGAPYEASMILVDGPIQYTDFEGKKVPSRWLSRMWESDQFPTGSPLSVVQVELTNFRRDPELEASWLTDTEEYYFGPAGTISCLDDPDSQYQVENGKIVRLVDSEALRNAELARMERNQGPRWVMWRNIFLGVVAFTSLAVLVWLRNR